MSHGIKDLDKWNSLERSAQGSKTHIGCRCEKSKGDFVTMCIMVMVFGKFTKIYHIQGCKSIKRKNITLEKHNKQSTPSNTLEIVQNYQYSSDHLLHSKSTKPVAQKEKARDHNLTSLNYGARNHKSYKVTWAASTSIFTDVPSNGKVVATVTAQDSWKGLSSAYELQVTWRLWEVLSIEEREERANKNGGKESRTKCGREERNKDESKRLCIALPMWENSISLFMSSWPRPTT